MSKPQLPVWTKWLLGIIAALVLGSVAWGSSTLIDHGERIAVGETQYEHLKEGQQRLEDGQTSINEKLDKLLLKP